MRFRADRAAKLAAEAGWHTDTERAAFFGVTQSNWSRVMSTATDPGALFIAAVLTSPAAADYPEQVSFAELFEVVSL